MNKEIEKTVEHLERQIHQGNERTTAVLLERVEKLINGIRQNVIDDQKERIEKLAKSDERWKSQLEYWAIFRIQNDRKNELLEKISRDLCRVANKT